MDEIVFNQEIRLSDEMLEYLADHYISSKIMGLEVGWSSQYCMTFSDFIWCYFKHQKGSIFEADFKRVEKYRPKYKRRGRLDDKNLGFLYKYYTHREWNRED